MAETLRTEIDDRGVATLTINRPEARNALDRALVDALTRALKQMSADKSVRVIILTGAGGAFCAGADLGRMQETAALSESENIDDAQAFGDLLAALRAAAQPVVARVNGAAYGGGAAFAAAADIAIAPESAEFALPGARLGLVPAVVFPYVVEAIGLRHARRFLLTGERFDAETARRIGLVHMVALDIQLDATMRYVIGALLAGAPRALADTKRLLTRLSSPNLDATFAAELARLFAVSRASEEAQEGIAAFQEDRKPGWAR